MHIVILIVKRIIIATGPQITLPVHVEFPFVRGKRPHSDVEFASLKQKWAFDVLLNDPVRVDLFRW